MIMLHWRPSISKPVLGLLGVFCFLTTNTGFGQELRVRTNYHAVVLNYNPRILKNGVYVTVQQAYHLRDVDALCSNYIAFIKKASGGQVNFSIADKYVLDEFAPSNDPDVDYTPENYDELISSGYDVWNHGKAN